MSVEDDGKSTGGADDEEEEEVSVSSSDLELVGSFGMRILPLGVTSATLGEEAEEIRWAAAIILPLKEAEALEAAARRSLFSVEVIARSRVKSFDGFPPDSGFALFACRHNLMNIKFYEYISTSLNE